MVRLQEIARLANRSVMTVSRALRDQPDVSPATKARIKAIAQELGYVPDSSAKLLRTRSSKLFGLVIPTLTNPIFSRVALAIQERAYALNYDVLLACTWNDPEREDVVIRRLLARRAEGLFIAPVYRITNEVRIYKELHARGIPTVLLGHPVPFCNDFPSVECDDLRAGYSVTEHLLNLGHTRIAFLCGPPGTPWTAERLEGYRRALRERDLDLDDKLVFQAGRTLEQGKQTAEQIVSEHPDATAIQAINDLVAVGCAEAMLAKGIQVPSDLSIAGFGNTMISEHCRVPLTTAGQPKRRLGAAAMDSMLQLLGGTRPDPKRISADLVLRASTGIAPAYSVLGRHNGASTTERAV